MGGGWGGGGRGRRWEKNCGERWGGKSGEFLLLAFCFCVTGCLNEEMGERERYLYRVVNGVRRNVGAKDLSFCVESFGKIDKNEKSSNFSL